MKITISDRLLALDLADRDLSDAWEDLQRFPSWIPTDPQERIAYKSRKERITSCKKQLEKAKAEFIDASLAQYRGL